MTFLSWRKEYEIGVLEIDTQHRRLVDMVNEFHDMQTQADRRDKSAKMLTGLVAYAEEHFLSEEKVMSDSNYPLLEKHREQHVELVKSISAINEWIATDPTAANAAVLNFLKKWLLEHIIKHDMDIGEFLRRKANQANKAQQNATLKKTEN